MPEVKVKGQGKMLGTQWLIFYTMCMLQSGRYMGSACRVLRKNTMTKEIQSKTSTRVFSSNQVTFTIKELRRGLLITLCLISEENAHHCDQCERTFKWKDSLRNHVKTVHSDETGRTYSCEICAASYFTQNALTNHKRYKHPTVQHPCPVCQKLFPLKHDLRRHMRGHTGKIVIFL